MILNNLLVKASESSVFNYAVRNGICIVRISNVIYKGTSVHTKVLTGLPKARSASFKLFYAGQNGSLPLMVQFYKYSGSGDSDLYLSCGNKGSSDITIGNASIEYIVSEL